VLAAVRIEIDPVARRANSSERRVDRVFDGDDERDDGAVV
jgi:hypothetical protein